jgi:hypothetical protein
LYSKFNCIYHKFTEWIRRGSVQFVQGKDRSKRQSKHPLVPCRPQLASHMLSPSWCMTSCPHNPTPFLHWCRGKPMALAPFTCHINHFAKLFSYTIYIYALRVSRNICNIIRFVSQVAYIYTCPEINTNKEWSSELENL